MRAFMIVLAFVGLLSAAGTQALAQETGHKPYEMPRSKVVQLKDSTTGRHYELYIRLPEEYGVGEKAEMLRPVIYTTDAKWHMEMVAGSTEYLMPDAIVVGISWQTDLGADRPDRSRYRDFTFPRDASTETRSREADSHMAFLRNDVIRYVETHYRADPERRSYFGYSLGGGFGAYILVSHPDTFQSYIIGSPVVAAGGDSYLFAQDAENAVERKGLRANVFLSYGEREEQRIVDLASVLATRLASRAQAGVTIERPVILEGADHGTAFPLTVVRGVTWLANLTNK